MGNAKPSDLVLRCYGYKQSNGKWFGLCLDFNLAVEADSPEQVKRKMKEVISSYIETVCDSKDEDSMSRLLKRRAPIKDWLSYWLSYCFLKLQIMWHNMFTFNEIIPFHLSHAC